MSANGIGSKIGTILIYYLPEKHNLLERPYGETSLTPLQLDKQRLQVGVGHGSIRKFLFVSPGLGNVTDTSEHT